MADELDELNKLAYPDAFFTVIKNSYKHIIVYFLAAINASDQWSTCLELIQ